jgi:hypothetical protein
VIRVADGRGEQGTRVARDSGADATPSGKQIGKPLMVKTRYKGNRHPDGRCADIPQQEYIP